MSTDAAGCAPEPTPDLPPLPDLPEPATFPCPASVNGEPTVAYIAHRYLLANAHGASRDVLDEFRRGWSVLQRFDRLCNQLKWPVEAVAIDWIACEYAKVLDKDYVAAYALPFRHLISWAEHHYRPAVPSPPVTVVVAPVVSIVIPHPLRTEANNDQADRNVPEWIQASKTEMIQYLWPKGYRHDTRKLEDARAGGILEYRPATCAIGHRKYEFRLADTQRHAQAAQALATTS